MKYFLLIIISLSLLVQTTSRSLILAAFSVNKEYISKNVCKKRLVKNNKCKGSCHLKFRLEQNEKQEKQLPASLNEKAEVVLFVSDSLFPGFVFQVSEKIYQPCAETTLSETDLFPVFHPPQSSTREFSFSAV